MGMDVGFFITMIVVFFIILLLMPYFSLLDLKDLNKLQDLAKATDETAKEMKNLTKAMNSVVMALEEMKNVDKEDDKNELF